MFYICHCYAFLLFPPELLSKCVDVLTREDGLTYGCDGQAGEMTRTLMMALYGEMTWSEETLKRYSLDSLPLSPGAYLKPCSAGLTA